MFRSRLKRRGFLQRSSLIALAPTAPAFLARTARAAISDRDGRVLVVIELSGGNDGINTLVPYADDGYPRNRMKLRLRTDRRLIRLNDRVGFHPALRPAADLLEEGRLAVVQGVGYPNPSRSHAVSMAIWRTARLEPREHNTFGWIGRAMDRAPSPPGEAPRMLMFGDEDPPVALRGRKSTSVSLSYMEDLVLDPGVVRSPLLPNSGEKGDLAAFTRRAALDAYAAADQFGPVMQSATPQATGYPPTRLAGRLHVVAQLIKAGFGTPVYYAIQPGYDTHSAQPPMHTRLLGELAGALKAFSDDLKAAKLDERVCVVCFSEFGRRVKENASFGTDHGTAGPVFLVGVGSKGRTDRRAPQPYRSRQQRRPENGDRFSPSVRVTAGRLAWPAFERGFGGLVRRTQHYERLVATAPTILPISPVRGDRSQRSSKESGERLSSERFPRMALHSNIARGSWMRSIRVRGTAIGKRISAPFPGNLAESVHQGASRGG